jgi:hypothetical protein
MSLGGCVTANVIASRTSWYNVTDNSRGFKPQRINMDNVRPEVRVIPVASRPMGSAKGSLVNSIRPMT